jgi:hypothetical protein
MRGIVRIVANAYKNGKAYGQQVTTQTRGWSVGAGSI